MNHKALGPLGVTRCGPAVFHWGKRTYVMGVLNLTLDSFSGDGLGGNVEAALEQARRFVAEGADIIDVGGESTRPGSAANPFVTAGRDKAIAPPLPTDEELERIIPIIQRLARELPVPISVDTYKSEVARRAVAAGAAMLNDIWGLKFDPQLAKVAAEHHLPIVLMHNQEQAVYRDLVGEVITSLRHGIEVALTAGVPWENIVIDPGIGFGKNADHSLELMRRLGELRVLGRPILLGTSRKSFIGKVLDRPPQQRLEGTAATVALGIAQGADIIRVHDVREMVLVARMTDAIVRGS